MAKFILLTDRSGKPLAVNIDNVAEFCDRGDGKTTIIYCSGNEENALATVVNDSFGNVLQKVNNILF